MTKYDAAWGKMVEEKNEETSKLHSVRRAFQILTENEEGKHGSYCSY